MAANTILNGFEGHVGRSRGGGVEARVDSRAGKRMGGGIKDRHGHGRVAGDRRAEEMPMKDGGSWREKGRGRKKQNGLNGEAAKEFLFFFSFLPTGRHERDLNKGRSGKKAGDDCHRGDGRWENPPSRNGNLERGRWVTAFPLPDWLAAARL